MPLGKVSERTLSNRRVIYLPRNVALIRFGGSPVRVGSGSGVGVGTGAGVGFGVGTGVGVGFGVGTGVGGGVGAGVGSGVGVEKNGGGVLARESGIPCMYPTL